MLFEIEGLSDSDLLVRVHELNHQDHRATARFVAHLAEFDSRRLYLAEGFSSLFTYCTQVLHFSEDTAYRRIEAARVARRFPVFLDRIADGSIHLTAITLLAPHLTAENHQALLESVRHRTRRQIEWILSRLVPGVERPTRGYVVPLPPAGSITPFSIEQAPGAHLATATRPGETSPGPSGGGVFDAASGPDTRAGQGGDSGPEGGGTPDPGLSSGSPAGTGRPPARTATLTALTPSNPLAAGLDLPAGETTGSTETDCFRMHVTISATTYRRLERARLLLSHTNPTGDLAAILDRALEMLVDQLERRKFGKLRGGRDPQVVSPKSSSRARVQVKDPSDRHLPTSIRRAVWRRDHGRCTFVGRSGNRCESDFQLEYHHLIAWARGGESTVRNLTLRCRAHNAHEAEISMGRRHQSTRTGASFDRPDRQSAARGAAHSVGRKRDVDEPEPHGNEGSPVASPSAGAAESPERPGHGAPKGREDGRIRSKTRQTTQRGRRRRRRTT